MDAVPVLGMPRQSTRIGTLRVRVRGSTQFAFGVNNSGNLSRDVILFTIAKMADLERKTGQWEILVQKDD